MRSFFKKVNTEIVGIIDIIFTIVLKYPKDNELTYPTNRRMD